MVQPQKLLMLLCGMLVMSLLKLSAQTDVLTIDKNPVSLQSDAGTYSIISSNNSVFSSSSFSIVASIYDLNNSVSTQTYQDSLEVCNFNKLVLEIDDPNEVILSATWYDDNGTQLSNSSTLEIMDCLTMDYIFETVTETDSFSDTIKVRCKDIDYGFYIEDINGGTVTDLNNDGTFDICKGDTIALFIENLNQDQTITYNWFGLNNFIIDNRNTNNLKLFGFEIGNYDVFLRMQNDNSCREDKLFSFSVNGLQNLDINAFTYDNTGTLINTFSADTVFLECLSYATLQLAVVGSSTTGNVEINWYDDVGTLLGSDPSVFVATDEDQSYTVEVIDEFGCSGTKSITIIADPISDLSITDFITNEELIDFENDGILEWCQNSDSYLLAVDNSVQNVFAYAWSGDIVIGGENTASPTLSTTEAGLYIVNLVVTSKNGCEHYFDIEVQIYDSNESDKIVYSQDCDSGNVEFYFDENNFNFYTWELEVENNEVVSISDNPAHYNYSSPGNYNLRLIPREEVYCGIDTIIQLIEIGDYGTQAALSINGLSCEGELLTIGVDREYSSEYTYQWTTPTDMGISGTESAELTITNFDAALHYGIYELQIQSEDCTYILDTLLSGPEVEISILEDTVCSNGNLIFDVLALTGISYVWDGPNGFYSEQKNPILTNVDFSDNGLYTLQVTHINSCISIHEVAIDNILTPIDAPVFTVDEPDCLGDDIILSTTYDAEIYSWIGPMGQRDDLEELNTTNQITIITDDSPAYLEGDWKLMITDSNGCTAVSDPLSIGIEENLPEPAILGKTTGCLGETIVVSTYNFEGAQYVWYMGNPDTSLAPFSNEQSVELSNLSAGTYTISLEVSVGNCTSELISQSIEVFEEVLFEPNYSFSISDDCEQFDVVLQTGLISSESIEYLWSGPNNFTSTEANPIIRNFNSENFGSYSVVVSNSQNCTSPVEFIDILEVPNTTSSILLEYDKQSKCTGDTLVVNSLGTNIATYFWEGPNGFNSNSPNLQLENIDESFNGLYILYAESVDGCQLSDSIFIDQIVSSLPSPDIDHQLLCEQEDIILTTNSIASSYIWYPPDENIDPIITDEPILQIESDDSNYLTGNWTLEVENETGCSSESVSAIVEQLASPAAPLLEVNEVVVCQSGSTTINIDNPENGVSYTWTLPDQSIITSQESFLTINNIDQNLAEGIISVQASNENCSSLELAYANIVVSDTIALVDQFIESRTCIGESIQLEAPTVEDVNYTWVGPNNFSSTVQNPLLEIQEEYNLSGEYVLTIESDNGCVSSSTTTLLLDRGIEAPEIYADQTSFCSGDELIIFASTYVGEHIVYNWMFPQNNIVENASTETNQLLIENVSLDNTGNYSVAVYVDGCLSYSSDLYFEIYDSPQVSLPSEYEICSSSNDNVLLEAEVTQGSGNYEYLWTGPAGFFSTESSPILDSLQLTYAGVYELVLTDLDFCTTQAVSASTIVQIVDGPEVPIISAGSELICEGEPIQINIENYDSEGVYNWTLTNGEIVQTIDPELIIEDVDSLTHSGLYSVAVILNECSSGSSNNIVVSVSQGPQIDLPTDYKACADLNDSILLEADITNGSGNYEYLWTGPAGFFSTESSPLLDSLLLANSGVYELVITDLDACSTQSFTATTNVQVVEIPETPIITTDSNLICSGDSIQINIENYVAKGTYLWSLNDGSEIVTSSPSLILPALDSIFNFGTYSVSLLLDECSSEASNELSIEIVEFPETLDISNSAGSSLACSGENISLDVPFIMDATYVWTGPNGFNSQLQNLVLSDVDSLSSGLYSLYLDIEGCRSSTFTTEIQVEEVPDKPVIETTPIVCEQDEVVLKVLNPDPELFYDWYRLDNDEFITTASELLFNSVNISNGGNYYVVARSMNCTSLDSDPELLEVEDPTLSESYAGEDAEVCEPDYILGDNLTTTKKGLWSIIDSNATAIILDDTSYQTIVSDLEIGANSFAWAIYDTVCINNLIDTVTIIYTPYPVATDDNFILEYNGFISNNVTDNDIMYSENHQVILISSTQNGELNLFGDGSFEYIPKDGFVGEDQFRYMICNDACLDNCTEAIAKLTIGDDIDCFIPSIFSPNQDGKNDYFKIPYLQKYTNSKVTIFNRWGDEVFHSDNYRSEWDGTHNGNGLPVGTYYYIVKVNDRNQTEKQGYIFIHR